MSENISKLPWLFIVEANGDPGANVVGPRGAPSRMISHAHQHRVEIRERGSIISSGIRSEGNTLTYIIAGPCIDVKDKSCIEECPVDCIYEGGRMLYIQPDECVDCGACEPVCPVEAIYYEDDVPGEFSEFKSINEEFFGELGSPGGASKVGAQESDHPVVAARPKG